MTETRGSRSYTLRWVALDKHVLLVAVRSASINHGAYIGAVKGEDYGEEALEVVANGSAVWERFAEIYFKGIASGPVEPLRQAEPFFDDSSMSDFRLRNPHILEVRAVDKHVLLVATEGPHNTWNAFIGAVKGEDYGAEAPEVITSGTGIPYDLARVCFEDIGSGPPKWSGKPRLRIDYEV